MNSPIKISQHFFYHEFISKGIWQTKDETFLRKILDVRIVNIMEMIRVGIDQPIFCNNWFWGGNSQYRGFRPAGA